MATRSWRPTPRPRSWPTTCRAWRMSEPRSMGRRSGAASATAFALPASRRASRVAGGCIGRLGRQLFDPIHPVGVEGEQALDLLHRRKRMLIGPDGLLGLPAIGLDAVVGRVALVRAVALVIA